MVPWSALCPERPFAGPLRSLFLFALTFVSLGGPNGSLWADVDPDTFPPELRALEWREVGPYRGGRSAAVAGLAADRQTYYFGATGGGVWKTGDGGRSWHNVSDGYFGGSIGAVAVSEWDPNVIYVGGGEKTVRGNVSHGDGIWKSTDAGETWAFSGLGDSRRIPRIRIHPKDPDRVYAAVLGHLFGPSEERGIYRSVDGGESWQRVLFVDPEVGAVDLVMDPTNPRILYAGFWRVRRTPYSLESGGQGSGMYKSMDGGDTWTLLNDSPGLPSGTLGIVGLAVSPSNNQNVYAAIEAEEGGIFRSRDGGKSWQRTNSERSLRQRAWYYTRIYADPADEEVVYVLNVRFHRSKDGGETFQPVPTPHGDNHDLWIDPNDSQRMIESNDGGANVSFDGGKTWTTQSNQPTAQFYRVSVDNDFPYRLLGGQQDNSAVRVRSRSAFGSSIGVRDWEPTAGGESGHIVAKPDDSDIVVGGSYDGFMVWTNHRTGESRSIDVWPDNPMGWGAAELEYRFQWNFPILFSHHDPDLLYVAANVVFRSDDLGHSWSAISPDLTRNEKSRMGSSGGPITQDNTSVEYYGTVFAVAESVHEANVLWAGSDDGRVHLTRDGGESWNDITPPTLPEWAQVNSVEAHPFVPGGAYLAATRYKSDDFSPYLYRTTDWGLSWQEITTGIAADHFTRVLRADPQRQGLLYAGTERGVYLSLDDGVSWEPLQLNLPIVPVTDLAVKEGDLIAATQGRGFWILDDLSVLRQSREETLEKGMHLYQPRPAVRLSAGGRRRENPGNSGSNPVPGAAFYYRLEEEPGEEAEVSLSVLDTASETIWTWTRKPEPGEEKAEAEAKAGDGAPDVRQLETKAGLNRFVWDLRYPPMTRFPKLILWNDMDHGPLAVPGSYRARLTVGESSQEVDFEVLADPRSSASIEDYRRQFEFVREGRDLLSRVHREIGDLRRLRRQLEALEKRFDSEPAEAGEGLTSLSADAAPDEGDAGARAELAASIKALLEELEPIEQALYQTKNQSRQDPLNFPVRLNDKLAGVMGLVAIGDSAPTRNAEAVKAELTAAIEAELDRLAVLWHERVPEVNRRVRELQIDAIAVDRGDAPDSGERVSEP